MGTELIKNVTKISRCNLQVLFFWTFIPILSLHARHLSVLQRERTLHVWTRCWTIPQSTPVHAYTALLLSHQSLLFSLWVKPVYCARPTWATKKLMSLDLRQMIQPRTASRISFKSNEILNCQTVAISGGDQSTIVTLLTMFWLSFRWVENTFLFNNLGIRTPL